MVKYAVVTGADRGLGYALTNQLLLEGYSVFAGQYLSNWNALEQLQSEHAGRLTILELDVASEKSVSEAARQITEQTGRIELLVNNAGICGNQEGNIFGGINYELLHQMYEVNAVGPLRMTEALQPLLLQGSEKLVVNISSEAGQINQTWREGWYGYCMSKAALNIQSNILHNELRKHGGKVLVIHPGWMKSYMSGELNEEAAITTEEAAVGIAGVIRAYSEDTTEREHPEFRDYSGAEMSWT